MATKKLALLLSLLIGTSVLLVSCESDEDNKIALAQECLNDLTDSSTNPEIQACIDKVSGIETPQAYTIRCSARFLSGGLTTSKIVTAFKDYDDAPANEKEATLIDNLALTSVGAADAAYADCAKTNVPGLLYIASLTRVGTLIVVNGAGGGDIQQAIDNCESGAQNCNLTAIAESVLTLSDLYCKGDAAQEQVCIDIATAEANAGGDLEQLAQILLNQFKD